VITRWDRAVVEAFQDAHRGPADWVLVQLSGWWVKSLVIVAIGLAADLASRRRFLSRGDAAHARAPAADQWAAAGFPLGAVLAAVSYGVATVLANALKIAFDRPRPPVGHPEIHPLVAVPHSASMPSGHATGAFAAAVAVGLVHPRLRWPLLALAALIALSRVWLGVHYLSDVVAGAALGSAVAYVACRVAAIIAARTSSP
jgi:membrane-associated phospholipid phosphatase